MPKLASRDIDTLVRAEDLKRRFDAGIYADGGGHMRHLSKLERWGYLTYVGLGRDIDGLVERDVHIFDITEAGVAALKAISQLRAAGRVK